jgi:NAD(P)-dependent dehydrogenase (short-subunit alcohol dehydrogenase family)
MGGRLDGRRILITGGSRGIGEAIATAAAAEGAALVLTARKAEGLAAAAARITAAVPGARVDWRAQHAGDAAAMEGLLAGLAAEGPPIDGIVHNAATNPYFGPVQGLSMAALDKTLEVNLKGPLALTQAWVAARDAAGLRGGSVVFVSSVYGLTAAPWQGAYALSKAALLSLMKTLAFELAGRDIRVNAIAPGLVETRFASAILDNPALAEVFTRRAALGRAGQPAEIAGAAVFLLSEEARFMTGQTMVVDGGYTAG